MYPSFASHRENTSKMFYIVYLPDFEKYIIIPHTWIKDAQKQFEKIVFSGVKRQLKQKHVCFWSNSPEASNSENGQDIPKENFIPNFSVDRSDNYPCEDGTFVCQIMAFRGEQFKSFAYRE